MVKHDRRQLPNDINRNHVSNLEIKFSFKIYRIVNVQIRQQKKEKEENHKSSESIRTKTDDDQQWRECVKWVHLRLHRNMCNNDVAMLWWDQIKSNKYGKFIDHHKNFDGYEATPSHNSNHFLSIPLDWLNWLPKLTSHSDRCLCKRSSWCVVCINEFYRMKEEW